MRWDEGRDRGIYLLYVMYVLQRLRDKCVRGMNNVFKSWNQCKRSG